MVIRENDTVSELRENMRGGKGAVTIKKLGADIPNVRLSALIVLPEGAGIGLHAHEGECEQYYILSGEGLYDDGASKTSVSAGDFTLCRSGESHAIENSGGGELRLLAYITLT